MKANSSRPGDQPKPATSGDLFPAGAKTPVSLHSASLFNGHQSVLIEHNGASYRLQSTKLGKLILTK